MAAAANPPVFNALNIIEVLAEDSDPSRSLVVVMSNAVIKRRSVQINNTVSTLIPQIVWSSHLRNL
jgi:hypothetical protein